MIFFVCLSFMKFLKKRKTTARRNLLTTSFKATKFNFSNQESESISRKTNIEISESGKYFFFIQLFHSESKRSKAN